MSRRSSSRDEAADVDLVPLDPVTGDTLGPDLSTVGADEPAPPDEWAHAMRRARRWRRLAAVLAGAALASALMAGWFGLSIRNLRGIERTWRSAMAVDQSRVTADLTIRALADGDATAARLPLDEVGDEAAGRLLAFEQALDRRRILDPKVSALRDEMIEALRFRRFQMTPERLQLGNTPLLRVDGMVDDQLERWDLERSSARQTELRSLDAALAGLRRFSTRATGTRLAAVSETGRIVEIDVDRSTILRNPLGEDPHNGSERATALFPVPGGIAVTMGNALSVLRPATDVSLPAAKVPLVDGTIVLRAAPDATGTSFWLVPIGRGGRVERAHIDSAGVDRSNPPSNVPEDRTVVGATNDELILSTNPQRGQLERWNPETGATTLLAPTNARFLAANDDLILWQGPLNFSDTGNGGFLHLLHLRTGEGDLIGLARTDAASAAISPDGKTIAVAAGPLAGRIGSVLLLEVGTTGLVGTSGPRVAVDGPAMTWSPDSRTLFWRTPDGELAVRHPAADGQPPQAELLRTGLQDLTAVAAFGR